MTGTGHVSMAREHRLHRRRVALVLVDREPDRCPHPLDIRASAEDGAVAGEHHAAQQRPAARGQRLEGRAQLADHLRVERVAHLGSRERDSRERPVPRDAQRAHRPRPARWNGSATARTWARSGSSSHTTSVSSGTSTVADGTGLADEPEHQPWTCRRPRRSRRDTRPRRRCLARPPPAGPRAPACRVPGAGRGATCGRSPRTGVHRFPGPGPRRAPPARRHRSGRGWGRQDP